MNIFLYIMTSNTHYLILINVKWALWLYLLNNLAVLILCYVFNVAKS